MTTPSSLVYLLRNITARELISSLERDGFFLYRKTRGVKQKSTGIRDGRQALIHYHRSNDTFPRGTLSDILRRTRWTVEDARRLGLI